MVVITPLITVSVSLSNNTLADWLATRLCSCSKLCFLLCRAGRPSDVGGGDGFASEREHGIRVFMPFRRGQSVSVLVCLGLVWLWSVQCRAENCC